MAKQNNGGKSPNSTKKKHSEYDSKNIDWATDKIKKSYDASTGQNKLAREVYGPGRYLPTVSNYDKVTKKGGVVTKGGVTEYSNGRAYRHSDGAKGDIKSSSNTGLMKFDGNGELKYTDLGASKYQWDGYDESRVKPIKKEAKVKKYADGTAGVVAKKYYNSAGQEIQRAKPVAPAYLPSNQITARPSGAAALNVKEGGDPNKYGKDQSSYINLSHRNGIAAKYKKGTKSVEVDERSPLLRAADDVAAMKNTASTVDKTVKDSFSGTGPVSTEQEIKTAKTDAVIKKAETPKPNNGLAKGGTQAVADWQKKRGLKADGAWGKETQAAYEKEQKAKTAKKPMAKKSVKAPLNHTLASEAKRTIPSKAADKVGPTPNRGYGRKETQDEQAARLMETSAIMDGIGHSKENQKIAQEIQKGSAKDREQFNKTGTALGVGAGALAVAGALTYGVTRRKGGAAKPAATATTAGNAKKVVADVSAGITARGKGKTKVAVPKASAATSTPASPVAAPKTPMVAKAKSAVASATNKAKSVVPSKMDVKRQIVKGRTIMRNVNGPYDAKAARAKSGKMTQASYDKARQTEYNAKIAERDAATSAKIASDKKPVTNQDYNASKQNIERVQADLKANPPRTGTPNTKKVAAEKAQAARKQEVQGKLSPMVQSVKSRPAKVKAELEAKAKKKALQEQRVGNLKASNEKRTNAKGERLASQGKDVSTMKKREDEFVSSVTKAKARAKVTANVQKDPAKYGYKKQIVGTQVGYNKVKKK